jgi:hypothetical protein
VAIKSKASARILGVVLWVGCGVAAINFLYTAWLRPKRAAAQPGPTYTVTLQQTFTRNGHSTYINMETQAIRADGSKMIRFSNAANAKHPEIFRTLYLSSGTMIHIRDIAGLTFTKSISPQEQRLPSNNCLLSSETYAGADTVSGYRTVKVTQAGRTGWMAVDYGCALVHDHWVHPDGTLTEKTLVSLVPGEPDPALFYVPSSYQSASLDTWRRPYGATPAGAHGHPAQKE